MAELRALQERFFALVTAREDVAGALARLGLDRAAAEALVASDRRLDATGRIGIYNDMYFMRLRGVLAQDFTALRAVLGEDDFRALVADYLDAFPPRDPCLRDFARDLPGFVAAHRDDNPLFAGRPWLADLAALEWARADQFDRPDAAVLTLGDLQALAPEQFASLQLHAVPASAIVDCGFAVDQLWRSIDDDDDDDGEADADRGDDEDVSDADPRPVDPPAPGPLRLLVWRFGLDVYHRRALADEAALLPTLLTGTSFGALCEQLGQDRSLEAAAQAAFALLSAWTKDGLLRKDGAALR